ncbi:hypothetical protein N9L92_01540 [Saprospiraceae bacterium]|nr:hypothetical protein [Saprospiraceae bacterium]
MLNAKELKGLILLILCFTSIILSAQPKTNSPYSRFGIGDVGDRNFVHSENMGGLGASIIHPNYINIVNPASLGFLEATSFDIGLFARNSGLRNLGETTYQHLWSGNLSYISLAVPLQNKLNDLLDRKKRNINATTAFTLIPLSIVGYDITAIDSSNTDIGPISRNFSGEGGTYQFTWSNAVKYKNLSFGLNFTYTFGEISNFNQLTVNDNFAAFQTSSENVASLSGFQYNLGVIYHHYFNLNEFKEQKTSTLKHMSFGLYGNSSTNFTSTETELNIIRQFILGSTNAVATDTLGSRVSEKFGGTLPAEIGFGATYYHGEKFALGVDYVHNSWSQFDANFVNNPLKNTYRLSFGGFYRPNYKSITNYFSRVYYRFGFHYKLVPTEELIINGGEDVKEVAVNFGLGLPFFYQRKISHANLGIAAGYFGRGTAIEERFIKLTFSFTFNDDEWLVKRKYN